MQPSFLACSNRAFPRPWGFHGFTTKPGPDRATAMAPPRLHTAPTTTTTTTNTALFVVCSYVWDLSVTLVGCVSVSARGEGRVRCVQQRNRTRVAKRQRAHRHNTTTGNNKNNRHSRRFEPQLRREPTEERARRRTRAGRTLDGGRPFVAPAPVGSRVITRRASRASRVRRRRRRRWRWRRASVAAGCRPLPPPPPAGRADR